MDSLRSPTKKEKLIEKNIFDILNEMLMGRFQMPAFHEDLKRLKVKNNQLVLSFADTVDIYSDEFVHSFFNDILQQKDAFINFLFKDTNDLWKFFNFCLRCLQNL